MKTRPTRHAWTSRFSPARHAPVLSGGMLCLGLLLGGVSHADPGVSFSPTRLDFGRQIYGRRTAPQTVRITNSGSTPLTIRSLSFTGSQPADFVIATDSGETTLAPGGSRTLAIQFRPNLPLEPVARSAVLAVSDNAAGSPQLVSLSGTAVVTFVERNPRSLNFGSLRVNSVSASQRIVVRNAGSDPLYIGRIDTGWTDPQREFRVDTTGIPFNTPIPADGSFSIGVSFQPRAVGQRTATLYIYDNAPFSPHLVSLSGTGVQPATVPAAPSNLTAQITNAVNPIHLTWKNNSRNEDHFQLQVQVVGELSWQDVTDPPIPAGSTSADVGNWLRGRSYLLRLRAVNAQGASDWSNIARADLPGPVPPPDISNVQARPDGSVVATWTDQWSALSYDVFRAALGGQPVQIGTVPGSARSYIDPGVPPGRYFYYVRATRSASTGPRIYPAGTSVLSAGHYAEVAAPTGP